jgi:hypothetical protein
MGEAYPAFSSKVGFSETSVIRFGLTHYPKLTSPARSSMMILFGEPGAEASSDAIQESKSWSSGTFLSPLTADSHYSFAVLYA